MSVVSNSQASVFTVTEAIVLVPEASGNADQLLNSPQLHLSAASLWVNQRAEASGSIIERGLDGGVNEQPFVVMYPHPPLPSSQGL